MTCDDCIKKEVCKYKEQCNVLERNIIGSKIEDVITLEVKCKHKETKPYTLPREPYIDPCRPKTPFGAPTCANPGGGIWTTDSTEPRSTVRFGDDTGCMPT